MARILKFYRWLAAGPAPACDRVLGAALQHAEPEWAERIMRILLDRGGESAWSELISRLPDLPAEVRERIESDGERRRAAIAEAMRNPSEAARLNALAAIERDLNPRMAYLIPDGLRDPSAEVRASSARLLRALAEKVLDAPDVPDRRRQLAEDRKLVADAAAAAFHSFDVHHRIEALEIGLWFAADLRAQLWPTISNHRSRVGVVLSEHLHEWSPVRLTGFLLTALANASWRQRAVDALSAASGAEMLIAVLRVSFVLDDPAIARQLGAVRGRSWFQGLDADAGGIPHELVVHIPRWVRHVGMSDGDRLAILNQWIATPSSALHRGAVYALADVGGDAARDQLRSVAEGGSPLARFAHWCVLSRDAGLVRSAASSSEQRLADRGSRWQAPAHSELDRDFILLWQVCRRTPAAQRSEIIQTLREHADVWRGLIRVHLGAPDPRDRILALQIVSTPDLALRFRHELDALCHDAVEGIRQLAATLLETIGRQPDEPVELDDAALSPDPESAAHEHLRAALEALVENMDAPVDAETMKRLRGLIHLAYGGRRSAHDFAGSGSGG